MKTKCLTALVLLLILLLWSEVALAEGALVLWVEEIRYSDPKPKTWGTQTREWIIIDASSSEKECRQKIDDKIMNCILNSDGLSKIEDVYYKVTESTITFLFFNKDAKPDDKVKRSQVLRYICLPDAIDPRNKNSEK